MLAAGVGESVIRQWLEVTDRRPAEIDSRGVIALTQAGASEELISTLLQLVGEPSAETSTAGPVPAQASGDVEAVIRLGAKQAWVDEDEPDRPREEPWDVYLYLDGDFVAWARPTLQGAPVEAQRSLPAGRHEMRVVLQRYQESRVGLTPESLVVPARIDFEARPGEPIEIEVDLRRIWGLWRVRKDGGPFSYSIRQGDQVLAEQGGTGGDPDRWPPICEDVEANFPDAGKAPKRFRESMSRCIRWAELWTGAGRSTSRAEILANLERYEFQSPQR
jgi:hypothetical protein